MTAAEAGGLPRPRTSFVGRADELTEALQLLQRTRLLTLIGPGGSGKTRLAIALATHIAEERAGGVHFVSLAAIEDPVLVPVSIAQSIGLQDARSGSLLDHLSAYMVTTDHLLVLDNFEQVLDAADFVGELLLRCPELRIIVTSRAPLHLSGEQEFPVPPLRVPEGPSARTAATVAACESAQLFAARAAASLPGFAIDEQNADAIAAIVQRLDGLPLAIELAAARVKLLPLHAILARLTDSLGLLVSGRRDVPDRQRTLRATIGWSYDLLDDGAQRLLSVMSVFRGGAGLDDIEAVCREGADFDLRVLDGLQKLVDHNLVRLMPSATTVPRYAMLETVREFAAEQLRASGLAGSVHAAHAAAFVRRASGLASPPLWPARPGLDMLEAEHDNFRAALDWYRHRDPGTALGLANRLTAFWSARGHFSEGRRRLGELLDLVPANDPGLIEGMNGAAWLATDQGDVSMANELLDRSIVHARSLADTMGEGTALFFRGRCRLISHDITGGASDIARAMELQAAAGDDGGRTAALWFAALPHLMVDRDIRIATDLLARSAELAQACDVPAVAARSWMLLGVGRIELGDLAGARAVLEKAAPALVDIGDQFAIPGVLSALAGLTAKTGRPWTALKLAGTAAEYEETHRTYRPVALRTFLAKWLSAAEKLPGAAELLAAGRQLTVEEALALAFEDPPATDRRTAGTLTPREAQVAALVARGLSNRDVAAELYLSVRTVEVHVDHVLTKLGLRSRTQLAAWAHEEGPLSRYT